MNPIANPSAEYRTARHEWIDPHRVSWAPTPLDRAAVEHYKHHPYRPYGGGLNSDGDPFVIRRASGELVGCNGKHRATAAMETGRLLWARVHTEPTTGTPQPGGRAPSGEGRRARVESNDVELMYTIAANAIRAGYLLVGTTERVYARDTGYPSRAVRVPGWEDDAVHQLLNRAWLSRGHPQRATCGAVALTGTNVVVPATTKAQVNRWRRAA